MPKTKNLLVMKSRWRTARRGWIEETGPLHSVHLQLLTKQRCISWLLQEDEMVNNARPQASAEFTGFSPAAKLKHEPFAAWLQGVHAKYAEG